MDFILEIPNHIHKEVCEDMIKRFDNDDRKTPGVTGSARKVEKSYKSSMDMVISGKSGWEDVDAYLCNKIRDACDKYREHLATKGLVNGLDYAFRNSNDMGYQMKKTTKGEYYQWHNDGLNKDARFLVMILYLNDLNPIYDGGGTAFHPTVGGGKVITPEQGKILVFPATCTYFHMGLPMVSDNPKYICTAWLCSKTS